MFPDAFLPNLALFLAGQLAAWGYLRTGLVRRGVVLMLVMWVLADAVLLLRFAYAETGTGYVAALLAMQCVAVLGALWFALGRVRRRWSRTARERGDLLAAGLRLYLQGRFADAQGLFTRLHRCDPWDPAAAIALANTLARTDRPRRAARLYRHARAVDRRRTYDGLVQAQLARVMPPPAMG